MDGVKFGMHRQGPLMDHEVRASGSKSGCAGFLGGWTTAHSPNQKGHSIQSKDPLCLWCGPQHLPMPPTCNSWWGSTISLEGEHVDHSLDLNRRELAGLPHGAGRLCRGAALLCLRWHTCGAPLVPKAATERGGEAQGGWPSKGFRKKAIGDELVLFAAGI